MFDNLGDLLGERGVVGLETVGDLEVVGDLLCSPLGPAANKSSLDGMSCSRVCGLSDSGPG